MPNCPACQIGLSNADVRFGRCPKCGALLNSDAEGEFQDNEVFAAEEFEDILDSIAGLSTDDIQTLAEIDQSAMQSLASLSESMLNSLTELPEDAAEALADAPEQSMTIVRGLSSDDSLSDDDSIEADGSSSASRDTSDIDQTVVGDDDMQEKTRTFASMPQEVIDLLAQLPPSAVEVLKLVPQSTLKSLASLSQDTREQLSSLPPSKLQELADAADESVVDGGSDTISEIPAGASNDVPVADLDTQVEMQIPQIAPDDDSETGEEMETIADTPIGLTTQIAEQLQSGEFDDDEGAIAVLSEEANADDATLADIPEGLAAKLKSGDFDDDEGATAVLSEEESGDDESFEEDDSEIMQTMLSDEMDSLDGISEGGSLHDEDSYAIGDSVDDGSITDGDSSFDQTINDVAELASAAADFGEPEQVELHQPREASSGDETIETGAYDGDCEENTQTMAMDDEAGSGGEEIEQTIMIDDEEGVQSEGDDIDQTMQLDESMPLPDDDENAQTMVLPDEDESDNIQTISDEFESDSEERRHLSDPDQTLPHDRFDSAEDENLKTMVEDDSIDATLSDFDGGSSIDQTMISDESEGDSNIATMVADDDDLSAEEMRTVNEVWPGAIDANTRPGMTIKSDGESLPKDLPKTTLVIKRRSFTEAKGEEGAEYQLLTKLGEGGMGIVWEATQTSIDRGVAIKMLKPNIKSKKGEQQKFLAEAVVTGELDHPNIVPIYDVGHDQKGSLFYSMKKVEGTPWLKKIRELSFQENVEILMKVADAMAFAHDRGVIHRDLKPENIMLGSFGEVLVMDWGLAQPTQVFRKRNTVKLSKSMGGTPAYMAPEMATGPITKIGPWSDIYLLGAILFEMITGKPPHTGKNTTQCLFAAIKNTIRPTNKSGELLDIAHRAMATNPEDRYETVLDFQDAIREYQEHSESIALSTRAADDLEEAKKSDDYQDYARARFGFQEAYDLWSENETAKQGVALASHAYAESAMRKGDLDLATTLLNKDEPTHQELLQKIKTAIADREQQKVELAQKEQRLKLFRKIGYAMAAAIIVIMAGAYVSVEAQRKIAVKNEQIATEQKQKAEEQEGIAKASAAEADMQRLAAVKAQKEAVEAQKEEERQRIAAVKAKEEAETAKMEEEKQRIAAVNAQKKALVAQKKALVAQAAAEKAQKEEEKQRKEADNQRMIAVAKEQKAVKAKEAEEYEAYIARIGLAAAKIDENAFDSALTLLNQCKPKHRNWEWGRLMHLCSQSDQTVEQESKINALALDGEGKKFVTGGEDGIVVVWSVKTQKRLLQLDHGDAMVNSVAFSPNGRLIATASNDANAYIKVWDAQSGKVVRELGAYDEPVLRTDGTDTGKRRVIGHTREVLSVDFSPNGDLLLTSGRDKKAVVWNIENGLARTELQGHTYWVWAARFSSDGRKLVTAGQDGIANIWVDQTAPNKPGWSGGVRKLPPFSGHDGPIYSADFSPDGKFVATGGDDRRVLVWKPEELKPFNYENIETNLSVVPKVEYIALNGHKASVRSVTFFTRGSISPNGGDASQTLVLSGGHDNTVKVWDLQTAKEITTFRGHDSWVRSVVFSPDGKSVFSASHDNKVKRWSVNEYEEIRVLQGRSLTGHADAVLSAQFSRDGKSIVTASQDRTAKRWDFGSGEVRKTFSEGHEFLTSGAAFLPGGTQLVTSAVDNTIRIWDVSRGTELARFDGTGRGAIFEISADGALMITGDVRDDSKGDEPWQAQLWDIKTQKLIRKFAGHRNEVTAVAISRDKKYVATGDSAGSCKLWNAETGDLVRELKPESKYLRRAHERKVFKIVFAPDNQSVITASGDNAPVRWSIETGKDTTICKHPDSLITMAITSDGKKMVTTCADGKLRVWEIATNQETVISERERYGMISLADDDKTLLTVNRGFGPLTDARGKVDLWDIETKKAIVPQSGTTFLDFNELGGRVWAGVFAPGAETVVTVGGEDARLWSRGESNTAALVTFKPHKAVAAASFSPDGRWVVTGSWDTSARVWDANTGLAVQKLEGHESYVNSVVFSPDGKWLLTASNDRTAKLWKFDRTQKSVTAVSTFVGHTDRVLQAVFSHDGKYVLTASTDATARVWAVDTNSSRITSAACILGVDKGHKLPVLCAGFSKDMQQVITGGEDSFAKLWNLTPTENGKFKADVVLELRGHTASITSIAFDPQGSRVLTGSEDYFVKLWDTKIPESPAGEQDDAEAIGNVTENVVPLAKEILSLARHTREVTSVAFSPTGRYILTGSRDGTAILWLARAWEGNVQTSRLRQPVPADSPTASRQLVE